MSGRGIVRNSRSPDSHPWAMRCPGSPGLSAGPCLLQDSRGRTKALRVRRGFRGSVGGLRMEPKTDPVISTSQGIRDSPARTN